MTDLADRLRAALDETERVARAVTAEGWHEDVAKSEGWNEYNEGVREHIALHDPERELRMVAAHRAILDLHRPSRPPRNLTAPEAWCGRCSEGRPYEYMSESWPCDTIKALAEAYGVEGQA